MPKTQKCDNATNEAVRKIFDDIDAGRAGFFMVERRSASNQTAYFQLFQVVNNEPINITHKVAAVIGKRLHLGAIPMGGMGTDRALLLMYYYVAYALERSEPLNWAHKYYRNVISTTY